MKRHDCLMLPAVIVTLVLTACGGAGGEDGICHEFGPGQVASTQLLGGTIENEGSAFDGELATAAALIPTSLGLGGGSISGTAAEVSDSATAGVAIRGVGGSRTLEVSITTYRGGIPGDVGIAGLQTGTSQVCPGTCIAKGDVTYFGIPTTRAFDGIQATVQQLVGTSEPLEILELCFTKQE